MRASWTLSKDCNLAIPMRHGDGFLEPGTYTVVLVTIPDEIRRPRPLRR